MWTVEAERVDTARARAILREYLADVIGSHHGRPATAAEVDEEAGDGDLDLLPPHGAFLVGSHDGAVAGCVGVRAIAAGVAELTRLYVRPSSRGTGGGAALTTAAEHAARAIGASALRLDTRGDLVAARRLYARLGYREIAPYNTAPYAEYWFEKDLRR